MASALRLAKMLNNAQQGFQTAQGLSGMIKPILGQYGGQYGEQVNNFLHMLGLGKHGKRGKRARHGGRYDPSQNRNYASNTHYQTGYGGALFKGKSPLSSNPNASNSLDLMNLMRLAQQAQQLYGQVQQGSNAIKPFLPESASNFLTSWGLGKPKHRGMPRKAHDGRSARAKIVREVMQSHGVSLPMASKIVKEQGLYHGGMLIS